MAQLSRENIYEDRADNPRDAYSGVIIKILVFDYDRGVPSVSGDFVKRNHRALDIAVDIVEEHFSCAVVYFCGLDYLMLR